MVVKDTAKEKEMQIRYCLQRRALERQKEEEKEDNASGHREHTVTVENCEAAAMATTGGGNYMIEETRRVFNDHLSLSLHLVNLFGQRAQYLCPKKTSELISSAVWTMKEIEID